MKKKHIDLLIWLAAMSMLVGLFVKFRFLPNGNDVILYAYCAWVVLLLIRFFLFAKKGLLEIARVAFSVIFLSYFQFSLFHWQYKNELDFVAYIALIVWMFLDLIMNWRNRGSVGMTFPRFRFAFVSILLVVIISGEIMEYFNLAYGIEIASISLYLGMVVMVFSSSGKELNARGKLG